MCMWLLYGPELLLARVPTLANFHRRVWGMVVIDLRRLLSCSFLFYLCPIQPLSLSSALVVCTYSASKLIISSQPIDLEFIGRGHGFWFARRVYSWHCSTDASANWLSLSMVCFHASLGHWARGRRLTAQLVNTQHTKIPQHTILMDTVCLQLFVLICVWSFLFTFPVPCILNFVVWKRKWIWKIHELIQFQILNKTSY